MKKIFTYLFAFFAFVTSVAAQEESTILSIGTDKTYYYEKVFEVPGKSKDEIFTAVKSWVIKNIKSQANTNYFDEENKSITTTPAFTCVFNSWCDFKMNIDVKDGKYKLSANSFNWHNMQGIVKTLGDYSGMTANKKTRTKILKDVDENFTKIIASIEESVAKGSNW